jgi:hypothetical protein
MAFILTIAGNFSIFRNVGLLALSLPGSLPLANNNFYRQLTDDPAITAGAEGLPQMQGSSW